MARFGAPSHRSFIYFQLRVEFSRFIYRLFCLLVVPHMKPLKFGYEFQVVHDFEYCLAAIPAVTKSKSLQVWNILKRIC